MTTYPPCTDAGGAYPALAGYTPMETGRRIVVALVDSALFLVVYLVVGLAGLAFPRNSGLVSGVMVVAFLVYLGFALWAMFARSARLSGVLMNATYVDVTTGLPSGGRLFGKQVLTSAISGISLGIVPLIMYFATIQEPLKRNWFDRTLGLMLVDARTGRRPGDAPPAAPVHVPPPVVAAVQFPMAGGAAPGAPLPPYSPPPANATPGTYARQGAPVAAPIPSPAAPQPSAVIPITEADGLITSTPRSVGAPTPPPVVAPAAFAPQVIVREMRSVDAAEADKTTLATGATPAPADSPGAHLRLDDGSLIALTPPTVLGRNPQAPGSHPDAVPRPVNDGLTSKTHLLVGRDDTGPWVIDLHSTNGVSVAKIPGMPPIKIEAGRKVHLPARAVVSFGGRTLTVD